MQTINIIIPSKGNITLIESKHYVASGGEASIYVKDNIAYKIYHDIKRCIPVDKIKELQAIKPKNILKPIDVIYNTKNKPIGYVMEFVKDATPVCKMFSKGFKQRNGVDDDKTIAFIKASQEALLAVHAAKCLAVDYNEMNILASPDFSMPYFIDVDSYQTPNHKATAIMQSIQDPQIKNNKWTELSDWFSFAIIAFQLYVGIHPYKGNHPKYAKNELVKRMTDGVSVFDSQVSVPKAFGDFSMIPNAHMKWFKSVFVDNKRSIPLMPDSTVSIAIPQTFHVISSSRDFETEFIVEFPDTIFACYNFIGVDYGVGSKRVYKNKTPLPSNIEGYKTKLSVSSDMSPIIAKHKNDMVVFENIKAQEIGKINATDIMDRNGCVYSVYKGKLKESSFSRLGNKTIHRVKSVSNISELAMNVFDGVIIQDLLGKSHVTIPYKQGFCITKSVSELNGYRILDAASRENVCVIIGEKKGKYYRFILSFDDNFNNYSMRVENDVTYVPVNLAVLENGVCLLVTDSEAEIFKGVNVKIIQNPPFNPDTLLHVINSKIHYVDGRKLFSVSMKK